MIMKAAVLYETNKPLKIENLIVPELKYGQVLVKILYTGICRSQINEIKAHKGPDKYLPHTLGHEASGIIEDVGEGVSKVIKKDYVVLTWIKSKGIDAPGAVYKTEEGKNINSGQITTFMEYSVVSENRVVKISKDISPKTAPFLGCAIPTGVGIIRNNLNVKKDSAIAIFGIGGIGFSVLLGSVSEGIKNIIAIDNNDYKLKAAKDAGATYTINSITENILDEIKKITKNEGVDYSVDCTGSIEVIETAFESVRFNGGVCVIAGNPAQGEKIKITPFDLIRGKNIIGSWGGGASPDIDIPYYIEKYNEGSLKIDKLSGKIYDFKDINNAIEDMEKGIVLRPIIRINGE